MESFGSKRRNYTLVLLAGAVGAASLCGGCETSGGTAATTGGIFGGLTALIASAAGMDTEEALLLGAGVGLLAGGITYYVVEAEKREAEAYELSRAQHMGQQRVEDLTVAEANAIETEDAKLAVLVSRDQTHSQVIMVDPDTLEPVDDQIYNVPNSEFAKMESVGDLQRKATAEESKHLSTQRVRDIGGDETGRRARASRSDAGSPGQRAGSASGAATSGSVNAEPTQPAETVVADSSEVDPERIRFGKLGSENVIFKL